MEFHYFTPQNDGDILHPNEPHIPLLFLIDTSGSMHGEPIKSLESGIIRLSEVLSRSDFAEVIDLAVVSFSDHAELVRPFSASNVRCEIALTAYGPTVLGEGIQTALHEARERRRKYMNYGVPYYKPWIILGTDCNYAENMPVLQNMVKELTEQNKLSLFAIGLPDCDNNILQALTERVVNVDDYDLDELFSFIGNCLIEGPNLGPFPIKPPPLPPNAHVISYDKW